MDKTLLCCGLLAPCLLVSSGAAAATFIDCDFDTAPSSLAEGGTYTCDTGNLTLFFASNLSGAVFEHVATGGWNESGAAKFYTHTEGNNSYRQLNPSSYRAITQQNLRYLIKIEAGGAAELGGKWHLADSGSWRSWYSIVGRAPSCGGDGRQPEIAYNNTLWVGHFGARSTACEGYQLCEAPSTWYDAVLTSCNVIHPTVFDYTEYEDEWVAVELERTSTGGYRVYLWTRDGAYNGAYYELDTTYSVNLGNAPIGAYLEGSGYVGKYFLIDEVEIADSRIGPPAGFARTALLRAPAGLRIVP